MMNIIFSFFCFLLISISFNSNSSCGNIETPNRQHSLVRLVLCQGREGLGKKPTSVPRELRYGKPSAEDLKSHPLARRVLSPIDLDIDGVLARQFSQISLGRQVGSKRKKMPLQSASKRRSPEFPEIKESL